MTHWSPVEQAVALATLREELPPRLAVELDLFGYVELDWPEERLVLRVHPRRDPLVDVHAARYTAAGPSVGELVETWRVPGQGDGAAPAALAGWVVQVHRAGSLIALQAVSRVEPVGAAALAPAV